MANTALYQLDQKGSLDYYFHKGQWQAWMSSARFVCVLSGKQHFNIPNKYHS